MKLQKFNQSKCENGALIFFQLENNFQARESGKKAKINVFKHEYE